MNKYNKDNPLRCFFAFEGYNSQGLALERLKQSDPTFEWVCIGRSEIDKYAIQAANAIFPENADRNYGDISKIDWENVPDFDLFTYSFPCTDISNAGQQKGLGKGSGTRSSLLWECQKAIEIKRPKYCLMENVAALVSEKFRPYYLEWERLMCRYGYTNYSRVLNAKDYGIPQNRERIFMVSILDDAHPFYWPEPIPLQKRLKDVLEDNVDEKFYLSEQTIKGFKDHCDRKAKEGCGFRFEPLSKESIGKCVTTRAGGRPDDNYIKEYGIYQNKETENIS